MMRAYKLKGIAYDTTGDEILDVEVVSGLDKTFLGCVLTLAS